jgi:hypothetical protein
MKNENKPKKAETGTLIILILTKIEKSCSRYRQMSLVVKQLF